MISIKKYKKNYKELPVSVKAAFWFVICNFLQKGISMITIPLFTRLLSTEQYGLFSVFQSWYSILGIFTSLNLQDATFNTGMVKYPEDKDNFTLSLQSLTTILTVILFVVYILNRDFWNELFNLPTILILVMFMEFLFIPAYSFWSARQKFEYKYVALIVSTLFIAIACPSVAIIAILHSSNKGEARIISFCLVQAIIGLAFYILNIHRGSKFVKIEYWKYALSFSIPLIPHYLSMTVLQQSDRIMIANMVGNSEAAIYSIAYNVSQIVLLVTKAINNSYIPYTYKSIQSKKYKSLKENSNRLVTVIAGMIVLLMLVGPEIIRIFATPDYYDAIWIIPPVSMSVFFMFLYPMFSNIEFYYEKSSIAMFSSIIGAIVNVILNYIFIPLFGYIAAGYTTLICYIIFVLMHYFGMKKVLKQNKVSEKIYDIRFFVVLSIIMFALMLVILMIYQYIYIRYSLIVILFVFLFVFRKKIFEIFVNLKKE